MIETVQNSAVVVFAIIGMALWVLFPIGMFISVSHVDKNTDQIIRLGHLRHYSEPDPEFNQRPSKKIKMRKPYFAFFHRKIRH
ncbi:MAG: hypothetical protein AB7I27_11170 [Bacteriovoracaceae bacterium]